MSKTPLEAMIIDRACTLSNVADLLTKGPHTPAVYRGIRLTLARDYLRLDNLLAIADQQASVTKLDEGL
jgi:hypothetical protein